MTKNSIPENPEQAPEEENANIRLSDLSDQQGNILTLKRFSERPLEQGRCLKGVFEQAELILIYFEGL
jgi:hypothetical protein